MIETTQETRCGWSVVSVTGRADAEAADQLESALRAAVGENSKVAVDLSGVSYISSAGLRAVLEGARAAGAANAEFAICALTASVKKVFDMSGLHHVLRIQEELPC